MTVKDERTRVSIQEARRLLSPEEIERQKKLVHPVNPV